MEDYIRLFSYYKFSFAVGEARKLVQLFEAGFGKEFGSHVIKCSFCGFMGDSRTSLETLQANHSKESSVCIVRNHCHESLETTLQEYGQQLQIQQPFSQIEYEKMILRILAQSPDFRYLSFAESQWIIRSGVAPKELVSQGFYSDSKNWAVQCASCNFRLESAATTAIFLRKHEVDRKMCPFNRRESDEFLRQSLFSHDVTGQFETDLGIQVTAVQRCGKRSAEDSQKSGFPFRKIRKNKEGNVSLASMIRRCGEFGVSEAEIKSSIRKNPDVVNSTSFEQFLDEILQPPQPMIRSELSTQTDAVTIASYWKCGICDTNPQNAAFLPCGHVFACHTCALFINTPPQNLKCCVCKVKLTGVQRLYLAQNMEEC